MLKKAESVLGKHDADVLEDLIKRVEALEGSKKAPVKKTSKKVSTNGPK